jgi:hypothetical protein
MKKVITLDSSEPKTEAEQIAKIMSDFVNNFGVDEKTFCETMAKDHRTLQQSFTRLCVKWFETLAKQQYFDARNEDSVMLAREFTEKCKDSLYLRCI